MLFIIKTNKKMPVIKNQNQCYKINLKLIPNQPKYNLPRFVKKSYIYKT